MLLGAVLFLIKPLPFALAAGGPDPSPSPSNYPIDGNLGGIRSIYTDGIAQLLRTWPPRAEPSLESDPNPVKIQCFSVPKNEFYIGVEQKMEVNAPLTRVAAVLDDFSGYAAIFDGLKGVRVDSRDRNRWLTFWEQEIPVPLIPNEKNEMIYLIDSSRTDRKIYRYQLQKSNHLKFNDGVIVIEARGPAKTSYTEFDFWDADWGLAKSFGEKKVWRENIEGILQSDYAVKIKAEHPDLANAEVLSQSQKLAKKSLSDERIKAKQIFQFLGKNPDSDAQGEPKSGR